MEPREELEERLRELERKLAWLSRSHADLDARLRRVESSIVFRSLKMVGRALGSAKQKLGQAVLHSPLHPVVRKFSGESPHTRQYREWLSRQNRATVEPGAGPLISILMPLHNPRPDWLAAAIQSVQNQSYTNWQLCICDDASAHPASAPSDPRIVSIESKEHLGISGALNAAWRVAKGEWVTFLDQDDLLSPDALAHVAKAIQEDAPDLLYSDEDWMTEDGTSVRPNFKPDWSPALLTTCMYLGHLLVVSRTQMERAGGFRSEYDGSQDYDLALRITEASEVRVKHIPRVLYHWRQHSGSTAASASAKPYTHDAGKRALQDAVRRRGWNAEISEGSGPNEYRVGYQLKDGPPVSIIICTRSSGLLERCLRAVEAKTNYRCRELIVVHHLQPGNEEVATVADRFQAIRVPYTGVFNFAVMNNLAAQTARGEFLLFLNDDVEPLEPEWLTRMCGHFADPGVGAVGARLQYPNGSIQHAGLAIGMMDGAGHPGRNLLQADLWKWLGFTREVTAVTGACLAVRRRLFQELGGFDSEFPVNYNDVDLCLRIWRAGHRVIFEAGAVLKHAESQSRTGGTAIDERERFFHRWHGVLEAGDPYYSPNLSRDSEQPELCAG